MRTKLLLAVSFLMLLCVGSWFAPDTRASQPFGDQDFTVVNKTGVVINSLYVSPSKEDDWEEDILGQDQLANGASVDISFSPKEQAALWDLKVEDSDGNALIWTGINLLEISKVTLFYNNGKATATVE
jgi:hypothetical protein